MPSIAQLKKQIAKERKRIAELERKKQLKRTAKDLRKELKILKSPTKRILRKVGDVTYKGLKKGAKETYKYAQRIKEAQIEEAKLKKKGKKNPRYNYDSGLGVSDIGLDIGF